MAPPHHHALNPIACYTVVTADWNSEEAKQSSTVFTLVKIDDSTIKIE
jgi:hypothetical protein